MARVCFHPYIFEQLIIILKSWLSGYLSVIDDDTVEFVSRKVAAVTGDVRKALDICRRAVELAMERGESRLYISEVYPGLKRWTYFYNTYMRTFPTHSMFFRYATQ